MGRPKSQPAYRRHKARECAVVTINGKNHYLGAWQSPESYAKYATLLAEWKRRGTVDPPATGDASPAIGDLAFTYLEHARRYYVKNGRPTSQVELVEAALKTLNEHYRATPVADFGPLKLKNLQQILSETAHKRTGKTHSRGYVNKLIACIKLMFRWAVSEELAPPAVFHGLQAVPGLKRGRCTARESKPVLPVDPAIVAATVKHLSPTVAAMVELQRLTGMRPGEVCQVRPCDVTIEPEGGAVFRPESHKTEHHGRERRVYIGPQGLAVLRPFLEREREAYCFDPREVVAWHLEQRRANRRTPLYPSHLERNATKRKRNPKRPAGIKFDDSSYRHAINRAVYRAFPPPKGSTKEQAREWRERYNWHPNQLRHLWATEARRRGESKRPGSVWVIRT